MHLRANDRLDGVIDLGSIVSVRQWQTTKQRRKHRCDPTGVADEARIVQYGYERDELDGGTSHYLSIRFGGETGTTDCRMISSNLFALGYRIDERAPASGLTSSSS
ncbi:MAG: hypothetical protein HYX55_02755 [Chloroflexi bacterium]|nr:hypothetical protein [Chloroflexota bacterium]